MRFARTDRMVPLLLAFLALGACSLFEARDPMEPPPPPTGCRSLTAPDALIANIEDLAVGYGRVSGLTCYGSMLDTTFIFHPDPGDSVDALPETPFIAWDEVVEGQVNSSVASQQDFIFADLEENAPPIISPDQTTELHFYDYMLRYSASGDPDTLRFTGTADLTFQRGRDGQWKITDWVDHRGSVSDSTWGLFRRGFRVGF